MTETAKLARCRCQPSHLDPSACPSYDGPRVTPLLWRVELVDDEHNTADAIVSADTIAQARRLAVREVRDYSGRGWGGRWRAANRDGGTVRIMEHPARVHAIVPGWD